MALALTVDLGSPSKEAVQALIEGLTLVNQVVMRQSGKRWPSLRAAGVRYRRTTAWQVCGMLLHRRYGDCKDLVAYEAARLRELGHRVTIRLTRTDQTWHVQIRLPNGAIFDPSRELGMKGNA